MTLGWCDIAYNAPGQVRAGSRAGPAESPRTSWGSHTGGFNSDVWGRVDDRQPEDELPLDIMIKTVGRPAGLGGSASNVNPWAACT